MSRDLFAGFVLGMVTVAGCATTGSFPWPYYSTQMPGECYQQGTLLGKSGADGWPDLPLSECEPDPLPSPGASPSPGPSPVLLKCMTVKVDDFYSIQADDEKCHADLIACQQGAPPSP